MPRYRTSETKSPPRIVIEMTEAEWGVLKTHLPYGFQKQIFKAIIHDLVSMWEEFGDDFTRAVIAKNISYRNFMEEYMERNYGNFSRFKGEILPANDTRGTTRTYQEYPGVEEDKT